MVGIASWDSSEGAGAWQSFVPIQLFSGGKLAKVVGEVLTCCWRYGRPMDKGILQGGPLDQQPDKGRPSSSEKKGTLFFVAVRNLYLFFLAENLTIFEFDFLEADFFLLPFEALGGSFLWLSFITCPRIFPPFPPFFFGRGCPSFFEANQRPG